MRTFLFLCATFTVCAAGDYQRNGGICQKSGSFGLPNDRFMGLYTRVDYMLDQIRTQQDVRINAALTKQVPVQIPQLYPVTVTKEDTFGIPVQDPKSLPVKNTQQVPVYLSLPRPFTVQVQKPYPVEIDSQVPVPVYIPAQIHSQQIQSQTNYQTPYTTDYQTGPSIGSIGYTNYQSFQDQSNQRNAYASADLGLNVQNFQGSYQSSSSLNGYIPSRFGGMYPNQGYNTYASSWKW